MRPYLALVTGGLVACNALSGLSDLAVEGDVGSPLAAEAGGESGSPDAFVLPDGALDPGVEAGDPDLPLEAAVADAPADVVAPLDAMPPAKLLVFVTSTTTVGTFGSVIAGDNLCQLRANAAGLPGKFVAWLSDNTGKANAKTRITRTGPWYLTTGELAVGSAAQLGGGGITHAIDRDENGALATGNAWTGSSNGIYAGWSCTSWTLATGGGEYGVVTASSSLWQNQTHAVCTTKMHLYCFQS